MSRRIRECGTTLVAILLVVLGCVGASDLPADDVLGRLVSIPDGVERIPALKSEFEARLLRIQEEGYAMEAVKALAYLFHANGYDAEARALYDWLIAASVAGEGRARLNYLAADAVKERGDSAAASAYLEASIRDFGAYALSYSRLGDARLKQNELTSAETFFRKALTRDGGLSSARLGLARIHELRGEDAAAIVELEKLLSFDPRNYNAQALLAQALRSRGEGRRAYEIERAFSVSTSPPVEDAWMEPVRDSLYDPQRLDFLFLDYYQIGDFGNALAFLDKMEALDPGNARYCRYRGTVFLKLEKYAEAAAVFQRGLALEGDSAALYPLLAQALRLGGFPVEAEAEARRGLEVAGPTTELLLELARLLVDRDALDECFDVLSTTLDLDPYHVEAHLLKGRVGMWTRKFEEAKYSLEMVGQLAPSNSVVLVRAGLVYMEAGNFAEALPFLERARSVSPFLADAVELLADVHLQLGKAARASGDRVGAIEYFRQCLEGQPRSREALTALAQVLMELQRFGEAEQAMRSLIEFGGGNAAAYQIFGDLLFRNGNVSEARRVWKQALESLPDGASQERLRQRLLIRLEGDEE